MAVGKFHYLHFGGFSFAFTILVAVIIALLTEPIPKEKVCNTCYQLYIDAVDSIILRQLLILTIAILINIAVISSNILVTPQQETKNRSSR